MALQDEIELTRAALERYAEHVGDGAGDRPPEAAVLEEAVESLATTLEELEVSVEELRASNAELVRTREALQAAHDRYRELFEHAPEPYLITDEHGTVEVANQHARDLLRVDGRQLEGSPLARWLPIEYRGALRDVLTRAAGGKSSHGVQLDLGPSMRPRYVLASVERTNRQDGATELRWVLSDGSAAAIARHRLTDTLRDMVRDTDELERTTSWQSTLLGAAAHDLRTPLTVIDTALETVLLHGDQLDEATRTRALQRARAQSMKLRRLLPSLLELSELQLRNAAVERIETDLEDMVDQVVADLDADRDHTIEVDLAVSTVQVDPLQVERILENLLANALRHSPPGSTVRVRSREGDGPRGVVLGVDDEGPGVPERDRDRVFKPFTRSSAETSGHSGLGLAIVSLFAAMHAGRAWVEDAPGGGAAFRVSLGHAV